MRPPIDSKAEALARHILENIMRRQRYTAETFDALVEALTGHETELALRNEMTAQIANYKRLCGRQEMEINRLKQKLRAAMRVSEVARLANVRYEHDRKGQDHG